MIALGLFGLFAAGKDLAADYLTQKGFAHISLSMLLREEAEKDPAYMNDRSFLGPFATQLKANEGHGVLAKRALLRLKEKTAISAIRHPEEVRVLKTIPGFVLLEIQAPIEVRHARATMRARDKSDALSFEDFKASEDRERKGTGGQLLDPIMDMVDVRIDNSGTPEELFKKLDELLTKLGP